MIKDMKLRALAPRTQDRYLHAIQGLAEHYHRPLCRITQEQVRKYLLYLIETKEYAKSTFNVDLAAIKFLYRTTPGRDWSLLKIKGSRTNRRLPIVLSRDEMWRLLGLVRYIHRVAITNSRIISVDDGKVTFRYKGSGASQKKTMTVSAEEFIRRFFAACAARWRSQSSLLWSVESHTSSEPL